ncbi:MAG: serine/threonine protein kinase [Planctomycetes bacterium]|nr:serine/threonine protein kinase [Planctomycetota bacterium]
MVARFHYDDATFRRLIRDQLPSHKEQEVTSHIERCADCQAKLEAVSESDISWSDVRRFLSPQAIETSNLASSTAGPGQTPPNTDERPMEFFAPSDRPNSLGRFGRYEITEILGRGGMGVVMRGYDPALDRHSAIKVLAPELATNASARHRFAREAKSAAAVVHEHVVPIQTVDEERGLPYLVMPVVEGQSLEQRVAQIGPLAVVEILRIGMQTASGLAAAHAQGLVHRDVKPANILLENGVERVMVTDFGLARAVDDASMTRSGVIAGTPQYMSPEQARGNDVDHRSDLFSLGSVLYFMCTGRSPFRAETMMGVLNRIANDTPRPLQKINADIPAWLQEIIERLLAKDPAQRFPTASEVSEVLGQWLAHVQQPDVVPRPAYPKQPSGAMAAMQSWSRGWKAVATVTGGLFLLLAAVFMVQQWNKRTTVSQDRVARAKAFARAQPTEMMRIRAEQTIVERLVAGKMEIAPLYWQPLCRYSDQSCGVLDATVWSWPDRGRPAVLQKIELYDAPTRKSEWFFCATSLSKDPVKLTSCGGIEWSSTSPGVQMHRLADAPAAPKGSADRWLQMIGIAERFSARFVDPPIKIELAMHPLARPLHLYSDPACGIVDGAIFGFAANDDNPDLVLLVELADDENSNPQWRYGLARMTLGQLVVCLDGMEVWSVPYARAPAVDEPALFDTWAFSWEPK